MHVLVSILRNMHTFSYMYMYVYTYKTLLPIQSRRYLPRLYEHAVLRAFTTYTVHMYMYTIISMITNKLQYFAK